MATFDINDQTRRVVNDGNGMIFSFPFSFQVNAASDIKVYVNDVLRVAGTHYNIVNSSDAAGLNPDGTGKVNFIRTPIDYTPATGAKVSIVSDVPASRSSVYTSGGNITAASLETDFDTLTMLIGDREEAINRSVQGPVSDPTTTSMILPTADVRKNKYMAFDGDGSVTTLAGTSAPLGSVDTGVIVDDAVTTSKIADNAVTASQIADNAVTRAAIAENAVGPDELDVDAAFLPGMIMMWPIAAAPSGWHFCDGRLLNKVTYNRLFQAIGFDYGQGPQVLGVVSQFKVPDLRGRVVAGKDFMSGSTSDAAGRLTTANSVVDGNTTGAVGGTAVVSSNTNSQVIVLKFIIKD